MRPATRARFRTHHKCPARPFYPTRDDAAEVADRNGNAEPERCDRCPGFHLRYVRKAR